MNLDEYIKSCTWVSGGSPTISDSRFWFPEHRRWMIPIITACDRKPSYLKYTLLSMLQAGLPAPVISWDEDRVGPVMAASNALKSVPKTIATESPVVVLLLQDDIWATTELLKRVLNMGTYGEYVCSLYRTIPLERKDFTTTYDAEKAADSDWAIRSGGVTSEYVAYNGGCGFFAKIDEASTLAQELPLHNGTPLPLAIGRVCTQKNIQHWQTKTNLVHHIGDVSCISGRPPEHRMPVDELLSGVVAELDKTLGREMEIPCLKTS